MLKIGVDPLAFLLCDIIKTEVIMMCFSKWFKKKDQKPAEKPPIRQEEPVTKPEEMVTPKIDPSPQAPIPPTPVVEEKTLTPEPLPEPIPEAKPEPISEVKLEPIPEVKTEVAPQAKPQPVVVEEEKTEARYSGKYDVFPEAGLFKYRLKASNGEILIVSKGYSTVKGVQSGIETLKRNVENANFEIYTDKNNYSQFILNSATGGRIIATGEFYESVKRCESAIESVKRFYKTEKVVILDELPAKEIREEILEAIPVEKKPMERLKYLKKKKNGCFV
jgi:uncharacterized protein YegP (UPF0339 family)